VHSLPDTALFESNIENWGFGSPGHTELIGIIASRCPQLRKLYTCLGLQDDDLAALGGGCPRLTSVDTISGDITDAGLMSIARSGALEALRLKGCIGLTEDGFLAAISLCPRLEIFDMASCNQLTDATLIALGQHCPILRVLNISYTNMTDDGLQAIAAGCPRLEVLCAKECYIGRAVEAIARSCPRLRSLIVDGIEVTETVLALAECCPLLEELGLYGCWIVGDEEITALACGCPDLQRLDIKDTAVAEDGLYSIREHCKKLKHITLDDGMYPGGVVDDSFFPAGVEVTLAYWS
jgi:F-box/leucine-rich repeat protein 2/20